MNEETIAALQGNYLDSSESDTSGSAFNFGPLKPQLIKTQGLGFNDQGTLSRPCFR